MANPMIAQALSAVLAVLMIAAAISDIRTRTISHALNGAMAALAIPFWIFAGLPFWPEIASQIGIAVATFAVFAGLFFLGGMGGGDVKMVGAVMLWVRPDLALPALTLVALSGGILSAGMLIHSRLRPKPEKPEVPYGVAIAIGGLWALHQQYLNQFPSIGAA